MPAKRVLFLGLFLGVGFSCLFFALFRQESSDKTSYYVKIPVSFFPFANEPLIKVEIEKKKYTLMLDTGSSHNFDLHKRVLAKIQDKTPLEIRKYFSLKGTSYPVQAFLSPRIRLHPRMEMGGAIVYEESIDFLTEGTTNQKTKSLSGKIKERLSLFYVDGRIGWSSFETLTCFFDFHNSSLFLAENMEALSADGTFNPADFIKIPLELSDCGPVISIQTDIGTKKFLLDSGSSHSAYRESSMQERDSMVLSMTIDGQNLDSWTFFSCPISSDQWNVDGVLGIDFFKKYRICLDFQDKKAYIQRPKNGNALTHQRC